MSPLIIILLSVAVGAAIGGITNHLAIKMLFFPRTKKYIAGMHIPFTPGLIPKRKEEIARSLGRVVSDYLVTSEGLANLLQTPEFQLKLEDKLKQWIIEWTGKEDTIEQVVHRYIGREKYEQLESHLSEWLREASIYGAEWLWDRQDQVELKLAELVPDWSEEKKVQLVDRLTTYIVQELKDEIRSARGDQLLRRLSQQFMEQAGGLLGTLAGIFMDENKIVTKVKKVAEQQLNSLRVQTLVKEFLLHKITEWENKSVTEAVEMITEGDGRKWFVHKSEQLLKWEEWISRLNQIQLKNMLLDRQEWLLDKAPETAEFLMSIAVNQLDRLMNAIELPKLVESQVHQFPIERLEGVILSVSGREFSAIKWLGALLGGVIGLFQALMLLWWYI